MLHTFRAGVFCQISVFGYAAGLSEEASVLSAGVLSAASSTGAAPSATALAAAESPAVARMASLTSLSASGAGSAAEAALSADSGLVSLSVRPVRYQLPLWRLNRSILSQTIQKGNHYAR